MRFALNILISLALVSQSVIAGAKPSNSDYGYRGAAYFYYTSRTIGEFLHNLPLKDQAAKETLKRLADKSGAARVKPRRLEWNSKTRTATVTIDRKSAKVGFIANNNGYFIVNGKRVKIEAGANIEKTWNQVAGILKPESAAKKHALLEILFPEAQAQGIGILEGLLLAAAITAVVVAVGAYVNQEVVQPAFCTNSVDPRACFRKISETIRVLTQEATPKVTITAFQCKDKNLAHAAFIREPNINLDYEATYHPDTTQILTPPALFPMPVEIPVSGGPKNMTFKTYYSETPNVQSKCTYELNEKFEVTKIVPGPGTSVCEQFGTGSTDSLLRVQAGVQFPIDMMMECCRSTVCEAEVTQYVSSPAGAPAEAPGQVKGTE